MRGGSRPNAGRKEWTAEQRAEAVERNREKREAREKERRSVLLEELLYPAVVTAFHADPGKWKDRYLEVELSKDQIKTAYGMEGLKEWMSYFSQAKIGGRDRFGNGYKTRWVMNLNKYGFILKLIESMGHTPKDLPKVGFPPDAMMQRLATIDERRFDKQLRRLERKNNDEAKQDRAELGLG